MKKLFLLLILSLSWAIIASSSIHAHPGRTDANGGHNCNVGACAGTYHYHNGGGGSTAPTAPAPTPTPRVPVVKIKQVKREEAIQIRSVIEYDYREFSEYSTKKQEGKTGKRIVTTGITYTDGQETSRADTNSEEIIKPIDEIIIQGGRSRSLAQIYGIAQAKKKFFESNRDKYNIWGKFESNKEVYLSIDGKKTKTTRTNSEGWFTFENIKITDEEVWVTVYSKNNSKSDSVSEKTRVNTKNKEVVTEYDLIHGE